jgi:hypothetical protein
LPRPMSWLGGDTPLDAFRTLNGARFFFLHSSGKWTIFKMVAVSIKLRRD